MSHFSNLKTLKAKQEFVKDKILNDDRWMLRGLIVIFEHQTSEEKNSQSAKVNNGVGFSRFDAELLTSFANHLINKGFLTKIQNKEYVDAKQIFTPKQIPLLRAKMAKYSGQLTRIAIDKQKKIS